MGVSSVDFLNKDTCRGCAHGIDSSFEFFAATVFEFAARMCLGKIRAGRVRMIGKNGCNALSGAADFIEDESQIADRRVVFEKQVTHGFDRTAFASSTDHANEMMGFELLTCADSGYDFSRKGRLIEPYLIQYLNEVIDICGRVQMKQFTGKFDNGPGFLLGFLRDRGCFHG